MSKLCLYESIKMEILFGLLIILGVILSWKLIFKKKTRSSRTNTGSNVEQWDVEDVCHWLTNLGPIYHEYEKTFRLNGINGKILLSEINEHTLFDLGVEKGLQRKIILHEINQLNSSNMSVGTELNKPFYKSFYGDYCPPIWMKLTNNNQYKNVLSYNLSNNDEKEYLQYLSRIYTWLGLLPSEHRIAHIDFVFNPIRYRIFLSQLEFIENRLQHPLFKSDLLTESNIEERLKALDQLKQLSLQVSHNRNVNIVRMWHGCSPETLPYLLSDGFATVSTRDEGWFGRGMYFTSSAKYATQYSGKFGCLVMSYVIILNPFPIITDDAPVHLDPTDFRFNGQANYKTYQCHYAPVAPISYEAKYLDNRPPLTGHDDAVYDELVVFQQADILPQIVVHLRKD